MPRRHEAFLVTPPDASKYPVTVVQAKIYAGITGDSDDATVQRLLYAAVKYFQQLTGHWLVQATFEQRWDGFHYGVWDRDAVSRTRLEQFALNALGLDWAPVQSVSWMRYYDQDGNLQTIDPSQYWTSLVARPPVLVPVLGTVWPVAQIGRPESVQVQYVAGYADPTTAEEGIAVAIMELVKHWYTQRGPIVSSGGVPKDVPYTLQSLMDLYSKRGYR